MPTPFDKEPPNYRATAAEETPYQRARQCWDQRLGSLWASARNWRLIAMINGIALIVALIALIIISRSVQPKLFIAEVNASGNVVNVERLKQRYSPTLAQKEYFITQFVEHLRTIPLDPVVARKNWLTAYYFLTPRAAEMLKQSWQKDNPVKKLGQETVTVTPLTIQAISANTFDVNWREQTFDRHGKAISEKDYNGVFTITVIAPHTQEKILQNPLGIYITHFTFSRQNHENSSQKN